MSIGPLEEQAARLPVSAEAEESLEHQEVEQLSREPNGELVVVEHREARLHQLLLDHDLSRVERSRLAVNLEVPALVVAHLR